jgi:glycosyltransferase involved in cell wall biosynthesis
MDLISIVIPYYNKQNTIVRSVKSVLNQTYENWELFIIDDNSDVPLNKVFNIHDSRIRLIVNNDNLGPGPTRQIGVDLTNGEYIAFLDADDWWDIQFLSHSMAAINNNIAGVWSRTILITDKSTNLKRYNHLYHSNIREYLLKYGHPICTSSFLWNKSKIARWSSLWTQQDSMFELETSLICNHLLPVGAALVFQDKTGTEHREHYIGQADNLINKFKVYKVLNSKVELSFVDKLRVFQWYFRIYQKLTLLNSDKSEEIYSHINNDFRINSKFIMSLINWILSKTKLNIKF